MSTRTVSVSCVPIGPYRVGNPPKVFTVDRIRWDAVVQTYRRGSTLERIVLRAAIAFALRAVVSE